MITWSECYEDDDGDDDGDGDGDDDGASDKIDQSAEKRQLPIVQHQSQSRTNHQLSCTNGAQITNNIVKTLQSDIYQVKSYINQNVPFASGSRPGRGWKCHQHQLLKSQRLQTKDISDTGYFQNNTNINIFKTGYSWNQKYLSLQHKIFSEPKNICQIITNILLIRTKSNHSREDIHEGEESQVEDESVCKVTLSDIE